MSFPLPLPGTAAREALGDLSTVAEILNPSNLARMSSFEHALSTARRAIAADPAINRINVICLRQENDERWLITVGPRGGWKRLFNFGTGRQ